MNENRAQSTKESRPYFPVRAEALQPLWSDNLVAASGLCRVWGWDVALIVRCTSAWDMHLRGSEAGWASAPLASSGQRCAAPSDLALMGGPWVGNLGPVALGLSIPLPSLHGPPEKRPPVPDLRRFSQNPAFTLHASELLLVLFFFLRLLCPRLRI